MTLHSKTAPKIQLSKPRSPCPVACTLDVIGDKWTLLIVRDLFLGCQYYKEFLTRPEKIATNILADRLNKLVKIGLVIKEKSSDNKRRDSYVLTDAGKSLKPVMGMMLDWGLTHIEGTEAQLLPSP